jgi:hypothetical protein
MSERLTPLHTWLRLPRDWFSDPRLITACELEGATGAVGYLLLLSRGCSTAGRFGDREEVAMGIRSHDCGIDSAAARRIAATLIEVGLVAPDGEGYAITDWRNFQPPRSLITPAKRERLNQSQDTVTKSQCTVTESHTTVTNPDSGVTERVEKSRTEQNTAEGVREGSATTPRFAVAANGIEVAILPEVRTANAVTCSHGYAWQLRPAGQRPDGSTFTAFYSGDHKLATGNWCKDRRPDEQH